MIKCVAEEENTNSSVASNNEAKENLDTPLQSASPMSNFPRDWKDIIGLKTFVLEVGELISFPPSPIWVTSFFQISDDATTAI